MHGRVTRIFVTPLIRALKEVLGHDHFLNYLDSFRYILAGEFSMDADLARQIRIPGDWGLEVGVLAEIHRNCALSRICQIELSDNYEHKHQALSMEDTSKGLLKMATEIAGSIFRTLASRGYVLTNELFVALQASYLRSAQDLIAWYDSDCEINGLLYDRHKEGSSAEAFTRCIAGAGRQFLETPAKAVYMPNWNRVVSAVPNIFNMLVDAVEKDNES